MMKKMMVNASDVARNAGAAVGGAANTELGVFGVNTETSITPNVSSDLQRRMVEKAHTINRGD